MSVEAWLAVVGMCLTIAIPCATLFIGIIGWFITRMITKQEERTERLEKQLQEFRNWKSRIEQVLEDRGIMRRSIRYQSPPPEINGGAG